MGYVYFHGQPGSPEELRLVRADGWSGAKDLLAPDRAGEGADLPLADYLDHLSRTILERFPQGPIRLVGFSLGGVIALDVARRLIEMAGDRDLSLDLIATPAPLGDGAVLKQMAGGLVFSLARTRPGLFGLLTSLQGTLSRRAPGLLYRQIFATAAGADSDLARDPAFETALRRILAHSLAAGAPAYRREVLAYAAHAGDSISRLERPVRLWQGLADTWTPPAMADELAAALPTATLRTFEGLSHYSTLRAALPEIFAGLE